MLHSIIVQFPFVLMLVGAVLLGLYLANYFFDKDIPQYLSRKIGHIAGGVAFILIPFLFTVWVWPFVLTVGFTLLLLYAKMKKPDTFRGVGGSGRSNAFAEINFPATGIILVGIFWGLFNQPWLAVVPLLFMAFGDAVTGIIRSKVYGKEVKGNWGSLFMLISCLILAYFIHPYWIGVCAAIVATLAEKYTKTRKFVDDNLTIPLLSGLTLGSCVGAKEC